MIDLIRGITALGHWNFEPRRLRIPYARDCSAARADNGCQLSVLEKRDESPCQVWTEKSGRNRFNKNKLEFVQPYAQARIEEPRF
jgi:hypothetical protein